MKNKFIWLGLSILLVAAMLLASCTTKTTSSTTATTTTSKTTSTTKTTTTTTTTNPITTTPTNTTATGNWWDSLGTPQYGGTMVLSSNTSFANFDPYQSELLVNCMSGYMGELFTDIWTEDPSVYTYNTSFRPYQYVGGDLAESWEFTDPSTFVVHVRQGVYWQNIPPANGREFTASDVVFHYDRLYGLGDGYTKMSPYLLTGANFKSLISVTNPTGTNDVIFKWSTSNPEFIYETMESTAQCNCIENPEAVQQWGNLTDWHHAIGTGPFILRDFVDGSSSILVKNPDYWRYDERYPQNPLPYVDSVKFLVMPNSSTAMAALRTGKIDMVSGTTLSDAKNMQETNSQILQVSIPLASTYTIDPRNDKAPYTDIRVRVALQEAIDLPTIAETLYAGTCSPYPSTTISSSLTGWAYTYQQWPSALQAQYAYNPTNAKQLLAAAGYSNGFNTDIVASTSFDLNLLQIVQDYFAKIGVIMDIKTMDNASWVNVLNAGKQDQLAYVQGIGLTTPPLISITHWMTGNPTDQIHISDPVYNAFYTNALASNNIDDIQKIVIEQQEYCAQQQFDISLLTPNSFDLYWPWLKGYSGQAGALRVGNTGPGHLGFYAARFWIDQNMKHSMEH